MADVAEARRPALAGIAAIGRHGNQTGAAGVVAREVPEAGLALLHQRRNAGEGLQSQVLEAFGVELPTGPRRVGTGEVSFIGRGPGQWLVVAEHQPDGGMERLLEDVCGSHAAVVDQSSGLVLLRLSGPHLRETLAKGVPVDLEAAAFSNGHAATTAVGGIGVTLWQEDQSPVFGLVVARSLAGSLWHWLEVSAAATGLDLA